MSRLITFITAILLLGSMVFQQSKRQQPFSILPFLDEQSLLVVRIQALEFKTDALVERAFVALYGHPAASEEEKNEIHRFQVHAKNWQSQFQQAGGREIYFIYSLTEPRAPLIVVSLNEGHDAKILEALLSHGASTTPPGKETPWFTRGEPVHSALLHQGLVLGSATSLKKVSTNNSTHRADLAAALPKPGNGQAQVAFSLTADARKVLEEIQPRLPRELGGESVTVLTRGVRQFTAHVSLTPPDSLTTELIVHSESAQAAQALNALFQKFMESLVAEIRPRHIQIVAPLQSLRPQVNQNQVRLTISANQSNQLLSTLVPVIAKSMRTNLFTSHLRQIAIAAHNYHNDFNCLPPQAITDKTGRPLLSWRVAILPYVGQDLLYKQFRLDEPWDGPHNKQLVAKMPAVFQHPNVPTQPGLTFYKVFYSKKGMKPAAALLDQGKVTLGALTIQDGTSNTLLATDAGAAVPWTKPEDILFDPQLPVPQLAGHKDDDKFWTAFCDGSVRSLPNRIKPEMLRALITRNGGEKIDFEKMNAK